MPKAKDLTNQKYGLLTAIRPLPERVNGKIVWECQCECGNITKIASTQWGRTQSCGCLQKKRTSEANRAKGLEGQRFGRLTVIKRENNKWKCQCDCGNITFVDTNHLNQGHTQSCGCLQKEKTSEASKVNRIGQTYGLLTVIEQDMEKSYPKCVVWKCQCECGNIISVRSNNLVTGDTISCGCSRVSQGEIKIAQLLLQAGLPFQTEMTFDTCRNPNTNKKLRFDFFVNNQYLIEFDGIQHFQEIYAEGKWGDTLENTQFRDQLKNEWSKSNNVPLIRIPYTHLTKLSISDLQLETSQFLIE